MSDHETGLAEWVPTASVETETPAQTIPRAGGCLPCTPLATSYRLALMESGKPAGGFASAAPTRPNLVRRPIARWREVASAIVAAFMQAALNRTTRGCFKQYAESDAMDSRPRPAVPIRAKIVVAGLVVLARLARIERGRSLAVWIAVGARPARCIWSGARGDGVALKQTVDAWSTPCPQTSFCLPRCRVVRVAGVGANSFF